MKIKFLRVDAVVAVAVVAASVALWFMPSPAPFGAPAGTPVRARVLSVDDSGVQQVGMMRYGSQTLEVELLDGAKAGERFRANNEMRAQLELDKSFSPGDTALVTLLPGDEAGKTTLAARDHWRLGWACLLLVGFCACLLAFGGWTGAKAVFSFLFSCLVVWKGVVPLLLAGWPAGLTVFAAVCLMTGVIMFLVAGATRKGVTAFLGSVLGICAGFCLVRIFSHLMRIDGATMPYVSALLYSGAAHLDLGDVFAAAAMLGASGAVMDLAMDIAAGMDEVARRNPELPSGELFVSGLRIGRSVVGTMTTTLLLAYSGGYLTLLMVFRAQGTPPLDFLNVALVASEVVKTLVGSFSLVLVAPATALAGARLLRGRR